jgi:hypothetical protein
MMNRIEGIRFNKFITILCLVFSIFSLSGCWTSAIPTPSIDQSDIQVAEDVLIYFFDALSRQDYEEAAQYHLTPNPLIYLYEDIDPNDAEALLEEACTLSEQSWCVFYCWKISEIVYREKLSSLEFIFHVRFEDEDGNMLVGGYNITPQPCLPDGCTHDEYTYQVVKVDGEFYVDGIPVFVGCWP